MGSFTDWLLFKPEKHAQNQAVLSADPRFPDLPVNTIGPVRTANPPNTSPSSPLSKPVTILAAIDMLPGNISEKALMAIPAARQALALRSGIAGSVPYHAIRESTGEKVNHYWLTWPEASLGYTRTVTMTRTALDLDLYGASLWIVRERYNDDLRTVKSYERIPKERWEQRDDTRQIFVDSKPINPADARLFVSPFGTDHALLKAAAPSVKMYYALLRLSRMYAENPQARENYQPVDPSVDYTDEQIQDFLAAVAEARNNGVSGFIPYGVEAKEVHQMTPEQMLLIEAQKFVVSEFARLFSLDGHWLGVESGGSRDYANVVDERRNLIDLAIIPQLIKPMEERMSFPDMTPLGQRVKANLDATLLRANTNDRYGAHEVGIRSGFLLPSEARSYEDLPPVPGIDALQSSTGRENARQAADAAARQAAGETV